MRAKQFLVSIPLAILILTANLNCNEKSTPQKPIKTNTDTVTADTSKIQPPKVKAKSVDTIRTQSLVFFMKSKSERQTLINRSSVATRYELKALFKQFNTTSKQFSNQIGKQNIKCQTSNAMKLVFITDTAEYIFNRVENDMVFGQIFFDGHNDIKIFDGYMELSELRDTAKKFFNLKGMQIQDTTIQDSASAETTPQDSVPTQKNDTTNKTQIIQP